MERNYVMTHTGGFGATFYDLDNPQKGNFVELPAKEVYKMANPIILLINGRLLQGSYKGKRICHLQAVTKENYCFSSVGGNGFDPNKIEGNLWVLRT